MVKKQKLQYLTKVLSAGGNSFLCNNPFKKRVLVGSTSFFYVHKRKKYISSIFRIWGMQNAYRTPNFSFKCKPDGRYVRCETIFREIAFPGSNSSPFFVSSHLVRGHPTPEQVLANLEQYKATLGKVANLVENDIHNPNTFVLTWFNRIIMLQANIAIQKKFEHVKAKLDSLSYNLENGVDPSTLDSYVVDFYTYSDILFLCKHYPQLLENNDQLGNIIVCNTFYYSQHMGMSDYNAFLRKLGILQEGSEILGFQGDFSGDLRSSTWAKNFLANPLNAESIVNTVHDPLPPYNGVKWDPIYGSEGHDGRGITLDGRSFFYEHTNLKPPFSAYRPGVVIGDADTLVSVARFNPVRNGIWKADFNEPRITEISKGSAVVQGFSDFVKTAKKKSWSIPRDTSKEPSVVVVNSEHSSHHSAAINDMSNFLSSTEASVKGSPQFRFLNAYLKKYDLEFVGRLGPEWLLFKNFKNGAKINVKVDPKDTYCTPQELASDPGVFDNYNKEQLNKSKNNLNKDNNS